MSPFPVGWCASTLEAEADTHVLWSGAHACWRVMHSSSWCTCCGTAALHYKSCAGAFTDLDCAGPPCACCGVCSLLRCSLCQCHQRFTLYVSPLNRVLTAHSLTPWRGPLIADVPATASTDQADCGLWLARHNRSVCAVWTSHPSARLPTPCIANGLPPCLP